MKRMKLLSILFLLLLNTLAVAETLPVINPIVSAGKALEFGIWKVYNDGTNIILLDQNDFRLYKNDSDRSNMGLVSDVDDTGFLLLSGGNGAPIDGYWYKQFAQKAHDAETKGQMQDARYEFGDKIFRVVGDEMTIFPRGADEQSDEIISKVVFNKYDNGLLLTGRNQITVIDPTFTVAPPTTGSLIPIDPTHTGAWYDPATDGSGGLINIANHSDGSVAVITWYDYNDDGSQMWLLGSSEPFQHGVTSVNFPAQITRKNNGEVSRSNWGTFTLKFTSCDSGTLVLKPDNKAEQPIPLTRLTKIAGLSC